MPSDRPIAPPENTLVAANARFTVLTDRMIRVEYAADGIFEDRPTLAVVNRDVGEVRFCRQVSGTEIVLHTDRLTVRYRPDGKGLGRGNLEIVFETGNGTGIWHPGMRDGGNLGGTVRTLDGVDGSNVKLGRGLVSRDGWVVIDDSANLVLDELAGGSRWVGPRPEGQRQDLYFLGYGHDYTAALRDASRVFGRQPLPPRFAFGYWWSRYWAYTDKEFEELVEQFDRMAVPIDVMVIDMDWHLDGWTGYTWDRRLFPDPAETLGWLKDRGLKVTLNLHPADGVGKHEEAFGEMCKLLGLDPETEERIPFDCTDPAFMAAYFGLLHHPQEDTGVDFWWMDWQQGTATNVPGLDPLPWLNYLHWEDMAERRAPKRPLVFSRFGGLGAGRYPIGFSGDTHSTWKSLAFQPDFTATASNVLFGYWSHDIGGHQPGEIEPELYLRWVQFGAFSPVLRTHTTKNDKSERRFWHYPDPYDRLLIEAVWLRYERVPYIYTEAWKCQSTGVSLCRPMYYNWPEEEAAYKAKGQYMFGEQLLVAPVVQPCAANDGLAAMRVWLPEGEWFDTATGDLVEGPGLFRRRYLISEIPVFVRPGAIIPGQRSTGRLGPGSYTDLVVTAYPGGNGEYVLYEDDGETTEYQRGKCAEIPLSQQQNGHRRVISIGPARGGYDGFSPHRSLEVRLPGSPPPAAVRARGRPLDWSYRPAETGWSYDGDQAETIIRLRQFDITQGVQVEVEGTPEIASEAAYGLRGLISRLKRLPFVAMPWHVDCQVDPRKKLPFEASQTGNRISRCPSSFKSELECLGSLLDQLPNAMRWILRQTPKDHEARSAVQQRLALLRRILRNLPPGVA